MLRRQTLYAIREELRQALNIETLTRGQLDFDASMITNTHKRKSTVDSESGEKVYLDPVRGCQSQGFKNSSCPLPSNIFFLSRITQEVNRMPVERNAMAYFTYSDSSAWENTEITAQSVWRRFLDLQVKPLREKKRETLKKMIFLAMQNWRSQTLHEKELHGPVRVRELIGINEHHWCRDWLPHWRLMHEILDGFDNKILMEVYRGTEKRRENSQTA